jgi:hypothetical protein
LLVEAETGCELERLGRDPVNLCHGAGTSIRPRYPRVGHKGVIYGGAVVTWSLVVNLYDLRGAL